MPANLGPIAGLERGFDGEVVLEGQRLQGRSRRVGFVFQEPRLFNPGVIRREIAVEPAHPRDRRDLRLAELKADMLTELYAAHVI